uniref:PiggyBac transposable element-derived protein domain-containing protein n=1 Tax=Timema shepardi TaxID=629360 RepID=A0A7R9FVR8_TIMSH|nr:unnamed protein product [Timema shepardi]
MDKELKSKGHYCTSIIRLNRIEKASLEEASTLKKKGLNQLLKQGDGAKKKIIQINQTACIINYNCYMEGVDRLYQNISTYRLYRLTSKGKEDKLDLLGFTRFIVQTYLSKYSIRVAPGPSPKRLKKRVFDNIRIDGINRVIVKSMTQTRSVECHKNTIKCKKCNVGCHVHCSEMFHSR